MINKKNYEEYVVSSLEGMLTTEEQAALDAFLYEHPEFKPDVDAYKVTFLVPDKAIVYPDKEKLMQPEPELHTASPFYRRYSGFLSIAATILLLMVFRFYLYNNDVKPGDAGEPSFAGHPGTGVDNLASNTHNSLIGRDPDDYFLAASLNSSDITSNDQAPGNENSTQVTPPNIESPQDIEVSNIPTRSAVYIPEKHNNHFSNVARNAAQSTAIRTNAMLTKHNSNSVIDNAASVGKTLLHLSGRQLPNENDQQFHVVTVSYEGKDFTFQKIIH